jgi:hypothetical protein
MSENLASACRIVIDLDPNDVNVRINFNLPAVNIEALGNQIAFVARGALNDRIESAILTWCAENEAKDFFDALADAIADTHRRIEAAMHVDEDDPMISPNLNKTNNDAYEED